MGIKTFKPTSKGVRFRTNSDYADITTSTPEKSLTTVLQSKGGRNNRGRITVRHQGGGNKKLYRIIDFKQGKLTVRHIGGGAKRKYRVIDFKRNKDGIPATVATIEYDPNRSARIALVVYKDGEKRYIVAPISLKVGDIIQSGEGADIKGGQLARSAGSYAQLLAKEGEYCHVRLPSGEIRLVKAECKATIGQVSNTEHENLKIGKAGRKRWKGVRPTVRGVAMNPVDHPMGGGEGRTSGGRHPTTPWGKPTKGYKTRKKNKPSNKYIVSKR